MTGFARILQSEFPVEKYRSVPSAAMPKPDIQIDDKKKLVGEVACVSFSWFPVSGIRVLAFHPKSQPRVMLALVSPKLPNPA